MREQAVGMQDRIGPQLPCVSSLNACMDGWRRIPEEIGYCMLVGGKGTGRWMTPLLQSGNSGIMVSKAEALFFPQLGCSADK